MVYQKKDANKQVWLGLLAVPSLARLKVEAFVPSVNDDGKFREPFPRTGPSGRIVEERPEEERIALLRNLMLRPRPPLSGN
jgi:hypothetical protein